MRIAARLIIGALAAGEEALGQRVRINGKDFVFQRIESLTPQGQRVSYLNGGFVVEGPGPVAVNGFEISVKEGEVLLANQRIAELRAGEEVYFPADMKWRVRPSSSDSP